MQLNASQQLLIATAWVDGRLDPAEARLLEQLLGRTGFSNDDLQRALAPPGPALDDLLKSIPEGRPRREVMSEVLRMCFADDVLELEEFDLIDRVARQLGLSQEELESLRQEVTAA